MTDRNRDDLTQRGVENSTEGKLDHAKGHVKDAIGGLTGDKSLQAEGKMDQLKGNAKDKIGEIQRDLGRDKEAR
jgi:uncharacterized protein YjbJ (UPF0337 family)